MDSQTAPPLIDATALASRGGSPGLAVIDLRSADDVAAGHVPGAVRSDYAADGWRVSRGGAAGLLPEAEQLSGLFGRLGVGPQDHVVIVPPGATSTGFSIAARICWTFRAAGHRRVSILDGGFPAWVASGAPVETGATVARPAPSYPVAFDESVRARLGDVAAAIADGSAALVDSRGPKSFTGEEQSPAAARAGRLPGALNVDGALAFDAATGRLRPRAELDRVFAPVPDGPVVSYCNTGQAAATDWFVLSEVMGRPDVALYDGSMSEWTADPARPVERG